MRWLFYIIIPFAFFLILFVFPWLHEKYDGCHQFEVLKKDNIRAPIVKKFIDTLNHNLEKIQYYDQESLVTKTLGPEHGNLYMKVNVGDSLVKRVGETHYIIKSKKGVDTIKGINYCKND